MKYPQCKIQNAKLVGTPIHILHFVFCIPYFAFYLSRNRPIVVTALVFLSGCGGGDQSAEAIRKARVALPLGKPQEAIDQLANATGAEALYLKAVALHNLQLVDASRDQLKKALELDRDNPKYRAFQLRNQLLEQQGQGKAADELLAIYEQHQSSSAIALFAASAYSAKGDAAKAVQAFQTSVALSEEAPEFLPEMLIYALRAQLGNDAKTVLAKLEKLGPTDPTVARQRVAVLVLVGDSEGAIRSAEALFQRERTSLDAALLYMRALTSAPATPSVEKSMNELLALFPQDDELVGMYAGYLARHERLTEAVDLVNTAIAKAPKGKDVRPLVNIAVDMPLEQGNADLAEAQIKRHQSQLTPPILLRYYQARLLYLREDHDAAAKMLVEVVKERDDPDPIKRAIVGRAMIWIQQVREMAERLRKSSEGK